VADVWCKDYDNFLFENRLEIVECTGPELSSCDARSLYKFASDLASTRSTEKGCLCHGFINLLTSIITARLNIRHSNFPPTHLMFVYAGV